jgi:hypothetical protein
MSLDQTELRQGGGGTLASLKETVSLDFPLRSFEASYNLSLVMSLDQTELRQEGGHWPLVKRQSH